MTRRWWAPVRGDARPSRRSATAPMYFVSSNTHSLVNLVTGTARAARGRDRRLRRARRARGPARGARALPRRAHRGLVGELPLLRRARLLRAPARPAELRSARREAERAVGVTHISLAHRAARLRPGHRARPARPGAGSTRGSAPSTPSGSRAAPARRSSTSSIRSASPPTTSCARSPTTRDDAARRLRARQGGDAERRRRRRDDLRRHPRRALGLDLLARQRVLRRRHRAVPRVRLRASTTSAR